MDLDRFDDGVVVGPSLFEPVCQQFNGLGAFASQDEKAGCRSAKSTHHPENIFHLR
jgi:hypothetical protein